MQQQRRFFKLLVRRSKSWCEGTISFPGYKGMPGRERGNKEERGSKEERE